MTGSLAMRSLAHRRTAFTATLVSAALGSAVIGSFATVGVASTGPVSDDDRATLSTLAEVIGGWGALIVLFAIISTAGITVQQRNEEIALLRTIGASGKQVRSLVRREAAVVLGIGALIGAAVAAAGGRVLLAAVRSSGLVADDVRFPSDSAGRSLTAAAPVAAGVLVVLVGVLAAGVAVRRASRDTALHALSAGRSEAGRMRPWRWIVALVCAGHAGSMATLTVVTDSSDPYDAMATSGSLSIVVAVGLAVIGPVLLRSGAWLLRPIVGRDAAGFLARFNTQRRAHLLAAVFGPVVVLTSAAVGTLALIGIDARTGPEQRTAEHRSIIMLNYAVVGMLVVFAAITVVNAFVAATAARREEFVRLGLLGATYPTVRGSVSAEARIVATAGVVCGVLASLATIVPFAVARDEGILPNGDLWVPPLVVVGVVALTIGAARMSVARLRLDWKALASQLAR